MMTGKHMLMLRTPRRRQCLKALGIQVRRKDCIKKAVRKRKGGAIDRKAMMHAAVWPGLCKLPIVHGDSGASNHEEAEKWLQQMSLWSEGKGRNCLFFVEY